MGSFEDTFNYILGTSDPNINLLNNPYINFKIYEVSREFENSPFIYKLSEKIKINKCKTEEVSTFVENIEIMPNNLCFEDKS